MRAIIVAFHAGALALTFKPALFRKYKKYGEKSKMSARRHFWWGRYPPVFADVGERKELWTGRMYRGETLDFPPSRESIASAGFVEIGVADDPPSQKNIASAGSLRGMRGDGSGFG